MQIIIIHDTPGRLRLALPGLAGSRVRAMDCEDALRALSGVRSARANALTGNLLVSYTPSLVTVEQIEACCAAWARDPATAPRRALEHHGHGQTTHAFALEAVAVMLAHVLGHAFSDAIWARVPRVRR
jgi:hypothetical protein